MLLISLSFGCKESVVDSVGRVEPALVDEEDAVVDVRDSVVAEVSGTFSLSFNNTWSVLYKDWDNATLDSGYWSADGRLFSEPVSLTVAAPCRAVDADHEIGNTPRGVLGPERIPFSIGGSPQYLDAEYWGGNTQWWYMWDPGFNGLPVPEQLQPGAYLEFDGFQPGIEVLESSIDEPQLVRSVESWEATGAVDLGVNDKEYTGLLVRWYTGEKVPYNAGGALCLWAPGEPREVLLDVYGWELGMPLYDVLLEVKRQELIQSTDETWLLSVSRLVFVRQGFL